MKRDTKILIIITIIVIIIILSINYLKKDINHDESTISCIAEKSILIVSKTCGHCINQLNILGDNKDKFQIFYIDENPDLLKQYNLQGVPSWIINNEKYEGVKQINQLKQIAGC